MKMLDLKSPSKIEVSQIVKTLNERFYRITPSKIEEIIDEYPSTGDIPALRRVFNTIDDKRAPLPLSVDAAKMEYTLISYLTRDLIRQQGAQLLDDESLLIAKALIVKRFNKLEEKFINTDGLNLYVAERCKGTNVTQALQAINKEVEKIGKQERKAKRLIDTTTLIGLCIASASFLTYFTNNIIKKEEVPANNATPVQKAEKNLLQQTQLQNNQRAL